MNGVFDFDSFQQGYGSSVHSDDDSDDDDEQSGQKRSRKSGVVNGCANPVSTLSLLQRLKFSSGLVRVLEFPALHEIRSCSETAEGLFIPLLVSGRVLTARLASSQMECQTGKRSTKWSSKNDARR